MGDMLLKHGHDLFGIDSTHNTTLYGFKLISLMVVDQDSNSGYPVSFCVSSGENKFFLRIMFFEIMVRGIISSKLKDINVSSCPLLQKRFPSWSPTKMLSDDDNGCWVVAQELIKSLASRLLCTWHVDKNWKKNV